MDDKPTIDYDTIAHTYAAQREVSPAVVEHLAARFAGLQAGSILEMGCGTADYLGALVDRLKIPGFGFDKSSQMLDQARRENPRLTLVRGDAEGRFPFEEDRFNLAFSVNLIHYLGSLRGFFGEVHRVAKGGAIVVTVTDSEDDIQRRTMSRYFPETMEIELERYPSIDAIRTTMDQTGWREIDVTHTERSFALDSLVLERFRRKAYSALRLIPQVCFEAGIARLRKDLDEGGAVVRELYTYVWGKK